MTERPRIQTCEEILAAIERLQRNLSTVPAGSPAASVFEPAIRQHKQMLAETEEARK